MLEFAPVRATVIRCFAALNVLNGFPAIPGAAVCRVAVDELLLLGEPGQQAHLMEQARIFVDGDPDSFVTAQSDAWSIWSISGPDFRRAFARLSANALPPPPAFVQGAVAQLPGKAIVFAESIVIMVTAAVGHHLPERIAAVSVDLEPRQGSAVALSIPSVVVPTFLADRTVKAKS